jgi:hypothetical protein
MYLCGLRARARARNSRPCDQPRLAVPSTAPASGFRGFLHRLRKASGNVMGNGNSSGASGSASARGAEKSPRVNLKNTQVCADCFFFFKFVDPLIGRGDGGGNEAPVP